MTTGVEIALIVAGTVVVLAAMFLYMVEPSSPPDKTSAAAKSAKVQEECEAAQLKLLKGEITDEAERRDVAAYVARYCD